MRSLIITLLFACMGWVSFAQCPNSGLTLRNQNGDFICPPGNEGSLYVNSSQSGVSYQLRVDEENVGLPLMGNGSRITWNNLDQTGTYTVVATNNNSGCTVTLNGSVTLRTSGQQATLHTVTGSNLCSIGSATVTLSNSTPGVSYRLLKDGSETHSPIQGTGSAISWNNIYSGVYTVRTNSGCYQMMRGSVEVGNPPQQRSVSGGGTVCRQSDDVNVRVNNSQSGVLYQLIKDGANFGEPRLGNGSSLSWSNGLVSGNYTVVASRNGDCAVNMYGNVEITNLQPTLFTVTGTGCTHEGASITLSDSETDVYYDLRLNDYSLGQLQGTGGALTWTSLHNPGTYTVFGYKNFNGCSVQMSGVISLGSPPNVYGIYGGGRVCSEEETTFVSLSHSEPSVKYQLQRDGLNVGMPLSGTSSTLTWPGIKQGGTYTVVGLIGDCLSQMQGEAIVTNDQPTVFDVGGGGCPGSTITLSGSEPNVTYYLRVNGNETNQQIQGTGGPLSWTSQMNVGIYTVMAYKHDGGCQVVMNGSPEIANPPGIATVSGGGSLCSEGQTTVVFLSSSEIGVNYQLKRDGVNLGAPVSGNNNSISWSISSGGTYTVVATKNGTQCSVEMYGNAIIQDFPSLFTVEGGGSFCEGGTGSTITLNGSQVGMVYQLSNGSTSVNLDGTGSALSWPNITQSGNYSVQAINPNTNCSRMMAGSVQITGTPAPAMYTVSGGGVFCGNALTSVSLSGSQVGTNYQLKINGIDSGTPIAGTGSSLTWPNLNTQGDYTILATDATTSCSRSMNGKVTITYNTLPTQFTLGVTGPTSFCVGSTGTSIVLSGSENMVNYQLKVDGVNSGPFIKGTGSQLTWPIASAEATSTRTYTIVATNAVTGCTQPMNGQAKLTAKAAPTQYTIGGGGIVCAGALGTSVTLSGSQSDASYQLKVNGVNSGAPISGTGGALSWSNLNTNGTYTIEAISSCSRMMLGSATVTVQPLPTAYAVGGGGTSCGTGVNVTLSGSQSGVNYQLKLNGVNIGAPVAGTGSLLTWSGQTTAGTYTVVGTTLSGACTQSMTGSASVTTIPSLTIFNLGGGGGFCAGGTGVNITLSGSQTGINYQLLLNGANNGTPIAGTGAALTWTNKTAAGSYTIIATNASVGCTQTMQGNATITVNPLPTIFSVSGGGSYCAGGTGATISVSGSEAGVNYQLKLNGVNTGTIVSGTGSPIRWDNQTALGTYTVVATSASTSCPSTMSGSATIATTSLPTQYTVSGGGSYCPGTNGMPVTLTGSQSGVIYKLLLNGSDVGAAMNGTGSALTWPNRTTEGNYTVTATNIATECVNTMLANATIALKASPSIFTASGGGILASSASSSSIQLDGSETGVDYQLKLESSNIQSAISGTGAALNWSGLSSEGIYKVSATKMSSGCNAIMNGAPRILITLSNNETILSNYAFQYKYDERNRMTHKKVPGADWTYFVYDIRDRMVMSQDGEQRKANKWTYTKYDELNRPIMTGLYTHTSRINQSEMRQLISTTLLAEKYDGNATTQGYTNLVFPISGTEILSVTYYDNYSFKSLLANTEFDYKSNLLACVNRLNGQYCQPGAASSNVIGLVTGTRTKVLNQNIWLSSANYYDDKNRLVQTTSNNYRGGIERVTSVFDFAGKILSAKSTNSEGAITHTILRTYEYDHAGRPTKTWHSLNGASAILLSMNEYNELGQVVDKKVHSTDNGSSFKQSVDYRYNIRGWLTSINNASLSRDVQSNDETTDLFGMNLSYNEELGTGNSALYNGNISAMKWSSNLGLGSIKERAYNFNYDAMNRLLSATQKERTTAWATSTSFHENDISYDLNGNILSLSRKGPQGSTLDILTYDYGTGTSRSNQLLKVGDLGDKTKGFTDGANTDNDYAYDSNGNMTRDKNKDISSITYNYLNLPDKVTKGSGEYVKYIYDATGRKLSQEVYHASNALQKKTDYVGEYIYESNMLQFINHDEGRVSMVTDSKVIFSNAGNTLVGIGTVGTTTALVTANGNQSYIEVSYAGSGARSGIMAGGVIPAQPGERYLIRAKGYRTGATPVNFMMRITINGTITDQGILAALPSSAATESWVEHTVTIPAGATDFYVNLVWHPVATGEKFYVNDFEIIKLGTPLTTPEYQYNLKDHLGNTRLTFTTKQDVDAATGTLEAANAAAEQNKFLRYANARRVQAGMFDHTNGAATGYAERLNGSANEKYGLARSLSVMPGDVINVEVFAKYADQNTSNWTQALTNLMSAITSNAGGIVVDGAGYSSSTASFSYAGLVNTSGSSAAAPKAFLNWIVFDRDFNFKDGGFVQVSQAAKETGTDGPHEKLSKSDILVKEAGYVYIYLSNENATRVEVFFDDFKVEHVKSPVISTQDYYPFGLTFNSYSRENSAPQDYKFNGKEEQSELSLGWIDYGLRMYQPDIGRWGVIDPAADKYYTYSPFVYCANSPTNIVDPNGADWIIEKTEKDGKVSYSITLNAKVYNNSGKKLDMASLTKSMKSQIESTFNTINIEGDIEVTTTVNIEAVSSLDDVKDTDHLVTIESDQNYEKYATSQGGDAGSNGYADAGGLKVVLPYKTATGILNNNTRTIAHEMGHTAGLYHPDASNFFGIVQGVNKLTIGEAQRNLMHSNSGSGKAIKAAQIKAMYNYYTAGKLNQQTHFNKESHTIFAPALSPPILRYQTRGGINYSMQKWVGFGDKLSTMFFGNP